IDSELDVHVALDLASAARVRELLRRLGHQGVAIVVEPVDQRPYGGIFLVFHQGRIVEGTHQATLGREMFEQPLVVDVEPKPACCSVKVGAVDKEGNAFVPIGGHEAFPIKSNKEWWARRRMECECRTRND